MRSDRSSAYVRMINDTPNYNNRLYRGITFILMTISFVLESESVVKNQNDISYLRNEDSRKKIIYE